MERKHKLGQLVCHPDSSHVCVVTGLHEPNKVTIARMNSRGLWVHAGLWNENELSEPDDSSMEDWAYHVGYLSGDR
jgi:hypothetical protein